MSELLVKPEHVDPDLIQTKQEFGTTLTQLVKAAGMSSGELAKKTSTPKSTLYDWLSGKNTPSQGLQKNFERLLRECEVIDETLVKRWWTARGRARLNEAKVPVEGAEPYRGLLSFGAGDAGWFFGREKLTGDLLDHVRAMHARGGGVLVVVGASGAGKSSLLRAGLLPALGSGALPGSEDWPVLSMTPGSGPVKEFAELLDGRSRAAARSAVDGHQGNGQQLVVIVDQFEQAFIAYTDEQGQQRFVAELCQTAAAPNGAIVIVGLRADFYAQALRYPQLLDAVGKHQVVVGPMTEAELRDVITRPATKAKTKIEDGLVDLLLRDVSPRNGRAAHHAGVLPLLSHALFMTWEQGGRRELTRSNYEHAGGIEGAVAASAEKVYADLDPVQKQRARRLFTSLVHALPDAADARRRVPLDEILSHADDDLEEVLRRFIAERLITIDEDAIEITHEALLSAWPQLREWLDSDRTSLLMAQQLNAAATAWRQSNRSHDMLYGGDRLATAHAWTAAHRDELPPATREFLDASLGQARRQTRRLYQTITALAVLLMLTVTFGGVAWQQRGAAVRLQAAAVHERDVAQSRALAVRANQLRTKDIALARQLSLAAYRIAPTAEARSSLLDASAVRPAIRMRGGDGIGMYAAAYHPNGKEIAAAADNTIRLWNIADPGHPVPLPPLPTSPDAKVYAIAFSPDGGLLAASSADATVRLWDTRNPTEPHQLGSLTGLGGKVYSVVFSPDDRLLAAASADGTVRLWQITSDGQATPLGQPWRVDGGAAKSVVFHPSNRYLAIGSDNGAVGIWDLADPAHPALAATPTGPTKAIGQLAFSPDGRLLGAGSADFNAYLWNVADPRTPSPAGAPLTGATSWINAVTFSPDSASFAVASSDIEVGVRVFDVATRHVTATLPHPAPATAVKFSPDGTTVVTAANDGTARIWPLPGPTLAMPFTVSGTMFSPDGHTLAIGSGDTQLWNVTNPARPTLYGPALTNPDGFSSSVAFTPDGRTLAAAHGRSGALQLWNVADPAHPVALGPPLPAHNHQQIESLAISPTGKVLATGSRDKTVRLWDITAPATPTPLTTLSGFDGYVLWVAFSPNGRLLAAGSADKTLRLWDISNPAAPQLLGQPLKPANHYVYSVVFSPDGRMMAVSLADSTIRLYDITNPDQPKRIGEPLSGPNDYVYSVSFTTDGTTLAAAATDGTVWLWDLHQRDRPTPIATLTLPIGGVYTLDFHPDDDVLVAGGAGNTVWLWHTNPEKAAANICATTGDSITPAEWAKYVPDRRYQPPCRT